MHLGFLEGKGWRLAAADPRQNRTWRITHGRLHELLSTASRPTNPQEGKVKQRPAYTKLELSKMTIDQIMEASDPEMRDHVLRVTNKAFAGDLKRQPGQSEGQFRVARREAVKADKAEFPRALRANLEAAILNSPHNQNQAKLDKMVSGWKMSDEEKATLEAHQEARARRDAMSDRENGRGFTAGPVPSAAEWDGGGAKPTQAPAPAPKPAANPTRPSTPTRRSRK